MRQLFAVLLRVLADRDGEVALVGLDVEVIRARLRRSRTVRTAVPTKPAASYEASTPRCRSTGSPSGSSSVSDDLRQLVALRARRSPPLASQSPPRSPSWPLVSMYKMKVAGLSNTRVVVQPTGARASGFTAVFVVRHAPCRRLRPPPIRPSDAARPGRAIDHAPAPLALGRWSDGRRCGGGDGGGG